MAAFVEFLERLFGEGRVLLQGRPQREPSEQRQVEELLTAAYERHALDVAGPPIAFDVSLATAVAEQVWFACWFLLHHGDPSAEIERCLPDLPSPASVSQHLSADLLLRFAVQVHRRARHVDAVDVLTKRLELLLRRYPLSGVLSDVEEGPLTPIQLDDHTGLLLLYAERLAENARPAWLPEGAAFPYVEMVFAERGLTVPAPLPARPANS